MKKKFMSTIAITFVLLTIVSLIASAAPLAAATTKVLSTNYTLVNMGSADANVNVQYIKDDGSTWDADTASESFQVLANFGQKIIAQYFDATMSTGKGSAVISSSEPLSAVVQIQARNQTPTTGAYSGFSGGSNSFYVPLVLKNRNTASGLARSQVMIQNVEPTGSIDVTIEFIPQPSYAPFTKNVTINAGVTYYWDATLESAGNMADGWGGSVVITAANQKQIVVISNLFFGANGLQTFNGFPVESASKEWVVPLFLSRLANGLSTPVAIQNVSGVTINAGEITMSCKSTLTTPATFTLTNTGVSLANNSAFYFNPVTDGTIPSPWTGSCRIVSSQNVVVFVQMRKPNITDETAAYEGFPASATDTKVVVPLMSKRQANGFATAATIQNLDKVNTAQVTLRYIPSPSYGGSQTPIVFDATIQPDGNLVQNFRLLNDVPQVPSGWFGTLIVEPKSGSTPRPIVGFVQLTNYLGVAGDTLMAHNAFTLP